MALGRRLKSAAVGLGCFTPQSVPSTANASGSLGHDRMEGKAAIVTGGANGIGRATALVLGEQGCSVTIADRDVATGERVAAHIRAAGGRSTFVETDVTSEASVSSLVETAVATFGRLDALVNVAGVNILARLLDTTLERWEAAMQINLRSVFLAIKASLPHLMKHGNGAVVSVSSIQGTRGFPNFPAYAASKAGMQGLTRQLAVDYAASGVRFNTVSPGGIETALNAHSQRLYPDLPPLGEGGDELTSLPNSDETSETATIGLAEYDPTPTLFVRGQPVHVANAVLFLASDDAAHITGQDLLVDGGHSIAGDLSRVPGIDYDLPKFATSKQVSDSDRDAN